MAGRGPSPKENRQNERDVPDRGEFRSAEAAGWQHGDRPAPPDDLQQASVDAWKAWMDSWFAAFWLPSDVPALRQLVRLFDQVETGEFQRAGELRLQMDTYGITPKGQQDRRWKPPKTVASVAAPGDGGGKSKSYGHLKSAG